MKKAVILNQSQQLGNEWKGTYLITQCLYSVLLSTGLYNVKLVPCMRLDNQSSGDNTLLVSSVNLSNDYYGQLLHDFSKDDILQLDIHMDSFDGKAKGCSAFFYPGSKGSEFASLVYEKVGNILGKRTLESRGGLYTLKNSIARNVLVEFGFYDSQFQQVKDNLIPICNSTASAIKEYFKI
jgi:hypothetical protein